MLGKSGSNGKEALSQFNYMIKKQIRILTINTWKCDGYYFGRMKILVKQLQEQACDIIVCQECFLSADGRVSTLETLSRRLLMDYVSSPARPKKRIISGISVDSFSGLGVLSKSPIKLLEDFDLPSSEVDGGRKTQLTEIVLEDGSKLLIANVHLTFLRDARELREQQLAEVMKKVKSYDGYQYRLIAGDFAAKPDAPEIKLFLKESGVADCYSLGGGSEPRDARAISRAFQLHNCVDHIFALPLPQGGYPEFADSQIVLDQPDPDTALYPSDHFGIVTTLLL